MAGLVQGGGMAATLNTTHTDIYTDVRRYLLSLFPDNEVIQGYGNNVPLPNSPFVLMNIITETDLNAQINTFDGDDTATASRSVETALQLDFYGSRSGERARVFQNLWRDYHACEHLEKCQPLYSESIRYIPLTNEEQNFEERWSITAYLTYNPTITHRQDYVHSVGVSIQHINR